MYTYLLLNIFTLIAPVGWSFEKQVHFVSKWKYALPAIGITGAVFIVWDAWFARWGVWSFNHEYLIDVWFFGLPIEEWMFFLSVPFACLFIYEVLKLLPQLDGFQTPSRILTGATAVVLLLLSIFVAEGLYTRTTFSLTAALLALNAVLNPAYLTRFWATYFIHLIPFFIVNGILTALPVVEYNDFENLGIRIGTVPIEDSIYSMLLLLMNVNLFELFTRYGQGEPVKAAQGQ